MDSLMGILDEATEVVVAAVSDGPQALDDLIDHCLEQTQLAAASEELRVDSGQLLLRHLQNDDRLWVVDDRVAHLSSLIDSLVLTHLLTEDEVANDTLSIFPDLDVLDFDGTALHTPAGSKLEYDIASERLTGPAGWLGDFEAGDLVQLQRSDGHLHIRPVDQVSDLERVADSIWSAWEQITGGDERIGVEPHDLVLNSAIVEPRIFAEPRSPLTDLIEAAGLERDGDWVGVPGSSFEPPGVVAQADLTQRLAEKYQFDSCCRSAFASVTEALWSRGGEIRARAVCRSLEHGPMVFAFTEWIEALFTDQSPLVADFLDQLVQAGRSHAAPALYVRAMLAEDIGDIAEAEADFEEAISRDPSFGPALGQLARFAFDRSEFRRARSLLSRAGVPEDDDFFRLVDSVGETTGAVGRNDPCPCGSGRKYKVCHSGKPIMSAAQQVKMMAAKLELFVASHRRPPIHLVNVMASGAPRELWPTLLNDPFAIGVTAFDGTGLIEFLELRYGLLPEAERDTFELWVDTPLRVWEVIETDGDALTVVRDTGTGDRETVHDRSLAGRAASGDQFLGRLVGYDGLMWGMGAVIPLVPGLRESAMDLLESDPYPDDLIAWYARLLAPPELYTTDGEEMTASAAELVPTADWESLETLLDDLYERDSAGAVEWRESVEIDDDHASIRATLRRDGDRLTVETMSAERMDRVLTTLGDAVQIIERTDRPIADVMADHTPGDRGEEPLELDDDLRREFIAQMEERWVNESIPALSGMTPFEAAADPTRREDLIALLNSFDRMDHAAASVITMNVDSLRARLGLEPS